MTQEEKELLIRDLVARICYKVCAKQYYSVFEDDFIIEGIIGEQIYAAYNSKISMTYPVEKIKPYLRPLLSMTEEEQNECINLIDIILSPSSESDKISKIIDCLNENIQLMDWLNKKHFDYRGLIEKGLAIEAPEGMYNTKTE